MKGTFAKHLVFSYGTLKRGFPNHQIMRRIRAFYVTDARTTRKYPLLLAGKWNTPFMIDKKGHAGSHHVSGELYRVDDKGLSVLDEFEGVHRSYYRRSKINLSTPDEKKRSEEAWCYFRYKATADLLADPSRFMSSFGPEAAKEYIPVHQRPGDWHIDP